jgi:DNA repair protein RecO (recombination protein O)
MKAQIVTTGIVLARTDFQEADRIITVLTPDQGKVKMMAKGVRRQGSKLAGGIELFSVSDMTYLPGRGDLATLVSSRLIKHYGSISADIRRTMLGYELLKRINRVTEEAVEEAYFDLLNLALAGLDDPGLSPEVTELWFNMQLLKVSGHSPGLMRDTEGQNLSADEQYLFDHDAMSFRLQKGGPFKAGHIKLLRLAYGTREPNVLKQLQGAGAHIRPALKLSANILRNHVRV